MEDSKISIDRELLRRIVEDHLDLAAEVRGFRQIKNRFGIGNADALLRYGAAHEGAEAEQREQIKGIYGAIVTALDAHRDAEAETCLGHLFPVSKQRKAAPRE